MNRAGGNRKAPRGQHADQDRRLDPSAQQHGHHEQPKQREQNVGTMQIAQRNRSGRVRHDDARIAQSDKRDEQAHARSHRGVEFVRNGPHNHLPHAHRGENQKRNAGKEDRAQRDVPIHMHLPNHRIREVSVEPHARRKCNRVSRKQAHQDKLPSAAARHVAAVTPAIGMPVWCRIDGFTKMMYAIVMNVVSPARHSVFHVVPRAAKSKYFSAHSISGIHEC